MTERLCEQHQDHETEFSSLLILLFTPLHVKLSSRKNELTNKLKRLTLTTTNTFLIAVLYQYRVGGGSSDSCQYIGLSIFMYILVFLLICYCLCFHCSCYLIQHLCYFDEFTYLSCPHMPYGVFNAAFSLTNPPQKVCIYCIFSF